MKLYKQIIFILIVFFKTGTLLSDNNLFNVNNIKLQKKGKSTNKDLANEAIKNGFDQLIGKILLKNDIAKLSGLNFASIKQLVTYYQISNISDEKSSDEEVSFNVTFDKDKIHELFFKKGISYSDISDRELYILPIFIKKNEIFVFNNNFFYEMWNEVSNEKLIEFILPLENIEIIKNINENKSNLISLEIEKIFLEYPNKNLAVVIIDGSKNVYLKTKIQGKKISKSFKLKKMNLTKDELYKEIITFSKKEIINLIKSENLIDVGAPSFLNAKLSVNKKTNLVEFNSRIKAIDLIENVYVEEFNKDYMNIRIKYLGKLEKIINQLKNNKINLQFLDDQWIIKTL